MRKFRTRSLRFQLGVLSSIAAVAPLAILVLVAFATSSVDVTSFDVEASSEETIREDGEQNVERAGELVVEEFFESPTPMPVLVAALILAVIGILVAWWWAGRAVQPMTTISAVANRIQAGSLDQRLDLHDEAAEVQDLADSFDAMLDRLEEASEVQRHLVEDASHELRTPLTALAVNTEVMLSTEGPTPDDYRSYVERNQAMIDRMGRSVDDLLEAARARHEQSRQVDNDLMSIVQRVVAQHRAINPLSWVDVIGPDHLLLGLHGPSVERALGNLLTNASEHGSPEVTVVVESDLDGHARLSVSDRGPGIPRDDLAHIFDRYYSTSRDGDHRGIGLALVKQVAEAHGSVEVTSPLPDLDHGTRVTMVFRNHQTR